MAQTARKVLKAFMNKVKEYEQLVNNQKEKREASTRRYMRKGEKNTRVGKKKG